MKDRIPTHSGRVTLKPVAGQADTYDMQRADQPTQEGTPLSKATFLTDETERAIWGDAGDRTVNAALFKLRGLVDEACKITYGSYAGTGVYGKDNPNSLTFDFEPKVIFISNGSQYATYDEYILWAVRGATYPISDYNNALNVSMTWNGNTVSWYGGNKERQLNVSGQTYVYVAIG